MKKRITSVVLSLGMFGLVLSSSQIVNAQIITRTATTRCSIIEHWDKIVFLILDTNLAEFTQLPVNSPLDIKVLDDPKTVADLKKKVLDFLSEHYPIPLAGIQLTPTMIRIRSVEYAQTCIESIATETTTLPPTPLD